jgi:hypothetical protein
MRKIIYAIMFAAGSAVAAQPNDGESYYIKTHTNQYLYVDGDKLGFGDEGQKAAFTVVNIGDKLFLKTPEGRYVSAEQKGQDEYSGKVTLQPAARSWEAVDFVEVDQGKYAIKSLKWNTFLRANTDIGFVDQSERRGRWEVFGLINGQTGRGEQFPAYAKTNTQQVAIYSIAAGLFVTVLAYNFWPVAKEVRAAADMVSPKKGAKVKKPATPPSRTSRRLSGLPPEEV